jgi:glycosyltransferase involved in cell wall biosynthesis
MISIIIPTYNRPSTLINLLNSIQSQTYTDYEVIVVNDAGDPIEYVLEIFTTIPITYVRHSENKGTASCRNTGIKASKGKYLTYVDDDDILYSHHLETLVKLLQNCKVAYTDSYQAIQEKQPDGLYKTVDRKVSHSYDVSHIMLLKKNWIPMLCVMHARECIYRAGNFDEYLRTLEDWDFLIRLSKYYKFNHSKVKSCEYAWRNDGSTKTSRRPKQQLNDAVKYIRSKYQYGQ